MVDEVHTEATGSFKFVRLLQENANRKKKSSTERKATAMAGDNI